MNTEIELTQLDHIQNQLCIITAQLEELLNFKKEMETSMLEMQSSGMMGMIGKLFK